MDDRVDRCLQIDAQWTQGRWGARYSSIFAFYLRSLVWISFFLQKLHLQQRVDLYVLNRVPSHTLVVKDFTFALINYLAVVSGNFLTPVQMVNYLTSTGVSACFQSMHLKNVKSLLQLQLFQQLQVLNIKNETGKIFTTLMCFQHFVPIRFLMKYIFSNLIGCIINKFNTYTRANKSIHKLFQLVLYSIDSS